jgi:putative endonuclease
VSGQGSIIGGRGEDIAMEWLRERGYYIVERNWRAGHYEVDIIAERYDTLHFVEVKTRKSGGWQSAYDSIDDQKIRSLRRAASYYRATHHMNHNIQFDLIAITYDSDEALMGDSAEGCLEVSYTENIL